LNYSPQSSNCYCSGSAFDLAMKGDPAALDRLFAPCMPKLQRTATRLFCNVQDAEDALQDGLLSAFRHLSRFQGRAQFSTWMHTIVVNAARSKLRKERSRPSISSLDQPLSEYEDLCVGDMVADTRSSVDEQYEQKEKHRILVEAIQGLPPMWRVVIWLYDIEGLQMKEIAARLRITISAAKTHHFRANRRIVKMVRNACARHRTENKLPLPELVAKPRAARVQTGPGL
jgi:RNA polymerase sigma-70 factor, ECF subfamily